MDEIDRAAEHIERERAGLLAQRKPSGPSATGHCAYCNAPVPTGMRWCDSLCRDAWQKENE